MLFNTKFFLFTAVIMIFVMLHLQVVSQVQASDPAPPPAKTVNGTTVAPTLTGNGILVAVLIGLFIIGVPSGLIDFIPMIFMFILITFFAGVLSEKEIGYGFSNAGLISVAFLGIILDPIGRLPLVRRFSFWAFSGEKGGRTWQLTKILLGQAVFSLALPNAPHAQLFTPILRDVAVASGMHPKYVLMPMSVLLSASNFILVASASNIITSGVLRDAGYGELGMGDVFISNIVPTIATILMCLLMSNLLYPSDIDEEEAADYKDDKKTNDGFMSQTKFRGLFEVFPEHLTQDVKKYNLVGRKVSEVLEFLPEALRNKIELVRIKTRTDKPPASIVASSTTTTTTTTQNNNNNEPAADAEGPSSTNNSTTTTMRNRGNAGSNLPSPYANDIDGTANINLFTVINDKQECLDHIVDENDRLIVEGTVADLRSFRTLLSLAWVGLSDSTFHNGVDVLSPRHSLHDGENEEEDSDHGEQQKQQEGTEMAEQNGNNNNTTADDNSLYKLRIENDGLHAFLPVDRAEMKKIRFAIVVISHFNAAIGRRLGDRFFVDQFRVSVVSLRTQTGDLLVGRELVYHALEAGDTLLLRLRPKATPIFANAANLQSNFYDVEGLEGLNPTDQMIKKHYVIVPTLFSKCVPWGEQVTTSGGATQHVIRLPEWWQNITLLIFVAIIAIAASGQSLTAVSGVGVAFYVVLGFMTPAETIKAVDWKLIVGIALSFGLGSAMTNSGLGKYVGYHIANSGAEGFPMVLLACFIVGAFTLVVGNKGSIQLLWPVLLPMVQSLHQPPKVAAIIIAQMCVAGFATVTGCPSHMVIAGPGNFSGPDFFKYGLPIMIVYTLLTAVFICIEFDIAF